MSEQIRVSVAVIGGGFTGLSAAYELAKAGASVAVLEAEEELGGLAAAFDVEGEKLDRFYHHWFTNDLEVMHLIDEIGLSDKVTINPTNTGMYYANQFFKLSTPMDLLRFTPLGFFDRVRLGLLALRARRVKNWMELEDKTAEQWLKELGGESVFRVVWEPLLKGKFGEAAARKVSAVWFWNKLKLRGGSRGKGGEERLAYLKGGFVSIATRLAERITQAGGHVITRAPVQSFRRDDGLWQVQTPKGVIVADHVIATPALPLIADMVKEWASPDYLQQLRRIEYLGNVCLVLELNNSLSSTYWLNVNDPTFPFVGVIEHTNFESTDTYGGRHIVYLSKYLPVDEALYSMSADEVLAYAMPHLKRMFPRFDESWILDHKVWKSRWSQPVVEKHYSRLIPSAEGPLPGLHIASMAQIYPEDRGTNYAVREGRKIGRHVVGLLGKSKQ
ncbi:NAD(P)/FAD-dependent oxidoreductase [Herbaspirillum huttiense F1]|jgi:UDP-galactopyranose mutase (EC 5.4.99.9)|uniref:NAD(P)/FAD-dependent oxidoreductase n=1 Tax=Herbaspirillum huttiense subsp. lycopersici TaxID=3074428 RepID=A0ABU2ENK2_9BURK|nr:MULTISPECIES: NAD(P)/FAD-dependent oxidoreductase [Herbaspirillum]MBP1314844.1 protoporphyrinogen oxidase [Herbaspirillum sp. 1130]MDR6741994.1 protoporphyrinogen oxidase [Herbaspirillum sp. 1173]MDR9849744.1 NAD(P)/FAD-dependent oxidoreductase [Herbaspirillum huttiense SE1]MDT0358321.1 NAD(P)/FAD-dependent oxidoreductase [Herbaspirillum huttiense F1]